MSSADRRKRILVAQALFPKEALNPLRTVADVYWLDEVKPEDLDGLLPTIDALYSHGWPRALEGKISRMKSLRYFQAGNAGVNGMRLGMLDKRVVCCSNAGAYSEEVAEFTMGLILAAAKSIVSFDRALRAGTYVRGEPSVKQHQELGGRAMLLRGKKLGIIGYGGIGRSTARLARAFGMEILAYGRGDAEDEPGVVQLRGEDGLFRLLRESDVVVLALPLTNRTRGLIGNRELAAMKRKAVFVNIARGEIVQEKAMYDHLVANPGFVYATDVWWPRDGRMEDTTPVNPFFKLDNVFGTPHASGPVAVLTGSVAKGAIENMLRFCNDQPLNNVIDRSEYE